MSKEKKQVHLIGGYHPSQRNMFTRTLTPAMRRGAHTAGLPDRPGNSTPGG